MSDPFQSFHKKQVFTPRGPVTYWVSPCDRGPTLVFLHSLLSDHREFLPQAEHFLGKYRMILWDSPAHGRSRPWDVFTYTYGAMALEAVLRQEGCEDPLLIGQDHGGAIAQIYLREHSAAGFLSLSSLPFGSDYYSPGESRRMYRSLWLCHCIPRTVLRKRLSCRRAESASARDFLSTGLAAFSRSELFRLLTMGYCGFQKENQDISLSCPVLLLTGGLDRLGHTGRRTALWAGKTGFSHQVISGAGHLLSLDAPEAVNKAIQDLLKQAQKKAV